MTETSTLTPHQELVNRLGTGHPQQQLLSVLNKIEDLEKKVNKSKLTVVEMKEPALIDAVGVDIPVKSRSEKMKESWAKRKAQCK